METSRKTWGVLHYNSIRLKFKSKLLTVYDMTKIVSYIMYYPIPIFEELLHQPMEVFGVKQNIQKILFNLSKIRLSHILSLNTLRV